MAAGKMKRMAKPGKVKKGKGKRWKKGHSSESNPETKKHRTAAKSRFFNPNSGPSDLTVEALAKHDEGADDDDADMHADGALSDTRSVGGNTFATWASNWTDCTNATFGRVHRYWHSNSAMHKEILAVLAAVTEVIKSQGGKETETEYFGALMTALTTVEGEESQAAVAYLLSLAVKRVPHAVLKSKFSEVSKTLLDLLASHINTSTPSIVRSLIVCLAGVLRVQDQAVWCHSSTLQVYNGLLVFVSHPKPKVRKAAQQAVRAVLKTSVFMLSGQPPPHHPAASTTAKYCISQIQTSGGGDEATATLHILELLRDVLAVLPHHSLKSVCETILMAMTLSNVLVKSVAMRALHGMFVAHPKASCLPAELNAQLITALYDYQPGENDVQPLGAWLTVMEKAHVNLANLDQKLCLSHLPRLFSACMMCLQSHRSEVTTAAAHTLKTLLKECVSPASGLVSAVVVSAPPGSGSSPIHKMFHAVEAGLSYQYHTSWNLVLQVIAAFFQITGPECYSIVRKCLASMADLRDSFQFAHKVELDAAIGNAVRSLGPKLVLTAVPLKITGENDDLNFPRSWMLPVLRDNIRNTELEFFSSYFLPLAAKLRVKSLEHGKAGEKVQSQSYDTLQLQIWSLLPGFCTAPTDVKQSFKGIAKILGSAITDRPDLRTEVMASLRKIINQNLDNKENSDEIARFAKNYLPLLFNLFTSSNEDEKSRSRLAVLETIKCYLKISEPQLMAIFFEKSIRKLSEPDMAAFNRHALLDLVCSMIPYLKQQQLTLLYRYVVDQLEDTDKTIQKKSYRCLEELCRCDSEDARGFVKVILVELRAVLVQSLSSSASSSKGPRLRCLVNIFEQLTTSEMDFVCAVVPEAILCTREVGERARAAAYSLLVAMANAMLRWADKDQEQEATRHYFELVMAGLAGSPLMISCTVMALTKMLYEFKDKVSSELLGSLMTSVLLLLKSKAREVVSAALGLVKILLVIFPDTTLAQFLKDLVSSLVAMKEDSRHHFRFKAKEIFTKLCRKFGHQTISSMVPYSMQKMLSNIRKTQERTKRRKAAANERDSDDEEEEMAAIKTKPETFEELLGDTDSELEEDSKEKGKGQKKGEKGRKGHGQGTWLQEGQEEEDIVDFLDPSVAKKVLATKPEVATKKKSKDHGFKRAPDGRLIIKEDEAEDKIDNMGKKAEPDIDDLEELLEAMGGPGQKPRKRKASTGIENMEEDEAPMAYKAGGHGIHRPVAGGKKKKSDQPKEVGAEYKAKKAGGDIKRKGKPDPYAYVPLEMKFLNKRKRAKASGQFKNLVKGAKKGAAKGAKQKKHK